MGDFEAGGERPEMGDFEPGGERTEMGDFEPGGDRPEMDGGPGGHSMGDNGGADLNYTDDDLDSYSTIWDGEVTGTGKADHKRVVKALKNISEGTDLEKYLDVDNIIPWDYNLSFGGMSAGGGDATDMVNDAIDTPFSGTEFFDALLENEEYLERYHSYLKQLVDEYVYGGRFDEVYNRIRTLIDPLVETDPTAFYSYDEYLIATDMLYQTVYLRAESVEGQINGTIPSTDEGQRQDSSSLIDASSINVEAMGQFDMGGGSKENPDIRN